MAPNLTLWDVMSAVVLMNPKMDTGMALTEQEGEAATTATTLAASNQTHAFDVNKPQLSGDLPQIIALLDQLMVLESSWLSGHTLAQTLFTSLHFMNIQHVVWSSDELQPTKDKWSNLPASYRVTSDEDFSCYTYGVVLMGNRLGTTDSIRLLERIELEWQNMLEQYNITNTEDKQERDLVDGLLNRHYLIGLNRLAIAPSDDTIYALVIRELKQAHQSLRNSVIPSISEDVSFAFDPHVHRQLACQAPPRPITLFDTSEAHALMDHMLLQLEYGCHIASIRSASVIWAALPIFSSYKPLPFARSQLLTLLTERLRLPGVQMIGRQFTRELLTMDGHRPAPKNYTFTFAKPNTRTQERPFVQCGDFLDQAAKLVVDTLYARTQNQARQPRIFGKLIVEWDQLQTKAKSLDTQWQERQSSKEEEYTHTSYLTSWVYHEKLTLMCDILMAGFELQLYGTHEYFMLSWYTYHLIFKKTQNLANIINSISVSEDDTVSTIDLTVIKQNYDIVKIQEDMQYGFLLLLVMLRHFNLLETTRGAYDNEMVRFANRFRQFNYVASPPILDISEYREQIAQLLETDPSEVIQSGQKALASARNSIIQLRNTFSSNDGNEDISVTTRTTDLVWYNKAQLDELNACARVCIANSLSKRKKRKKKDDDDDDHLLPTISFNFTYHHRQPDVTLKYT
ncbi:Mak10 subunit, NatC N-terminal acetyltransferase-domain-containing protein [Syncephalis plumigaleata]|nr:Mak10 subunit, NatC N-terminal acetyltransferase-domain-containing protein [Syncephalis plumigaleata]